MIGVELRTSGRLSSNLEDGSVKTHLHTSPIVVKIKSNQWSITLYLVSKQLGTTNRTRAHTGLMDRLQWRAV